VGKEIAMARRVGLGLVMVVVALVLGGGVALAAVKYGTEGQDELFGTNDSDVLYGRGGSDFLEGCGGDDVLYGGGGMDLVGDGLCRRSGDDKLYGGDGGDEIFSFPGDDVLYGGDGNDALFEGQGHNVLFGGGGNDFFQATAVNPDEPGSERTTPRKRDLIFCGPGRDTVVVDPGGIDEVAPDCEKVLVRTGEGDMGL
jgi:Ca2+-binding RTX toxin-like protein